MQIESAIRHTLRFRPKGCCFGTFLKGHMSDKDLSEQLRLARYQGGHELCEKVLLFIKGLESPQRERLRANVIR